MPAGAHSDVGAPRGSADRVRVAYLGGIGRSGSTLLSRALHRLPGCVAVGELSNLWKQSVVNGAVCGCGRAFHDCPFWTSVGEVAFGGWHAVDAAELVRLRRTVERLRDLPRLLVADPSPAHRAAVERHRQHTLRLYEAVREVSGCPVVVDNSKLPSRAALLRTMPEIDLRVIHLVRSSYGVCYSWSKRVVRSDAVAAEMPRFPVTGSAVRWTLFNECFEVLRRLGVPTQRLRYEDFVADPRATLAAVAAFLDIEVTDDDLRYVDGRHVELVEDHSVWGNPMRMRQGREHLRVDEAWRSQLSAPDRRRITVLTLGGDRRYGYGRRNGGADGAGATTATPGSGPAGA